MDPDPFPTEIIPASLILVAVTLGLNREYIFEIRHLQIFADEIPELLRPAVKQVIIFTVIM